MKTISLSEWIASDVKGQDRIGQGRAGQGRTGQGMTGQDRTGHDDMEGSAVHSARYAFDLTYIPWQCYG